MQPMLRSVVPYKMHRLIWDALSPVLPEDFPYINTHFLAAVKTTLVPLAIGSHTLMNFMKK